MTNTTTTRTHRSLRKRLAFDYEETFGIHASARLCSASELVMIQVRLIGQTKYGAEAMRLDLDP